jgi:PKD repeat protein
MRRKISLLLLAILAPSVLWAQGYFEVTQGGLTRSVQPLVGTQDAAAFYAYAGFDFSSTNPLAADDTTVLFLYRDPAGELYLFVIHDASTSTTGGSVELSIQGIPAVADVLVQDDPSNVDQNDTYDVATGRFTWVWGAGRTDGMVLGPLGPEFQLTITPVALTGITAVAFLSGDIAAPERIELNTVDSITLVGSPNQRPVVSFTVSPAEPRIRQEVKFDATDSYDPDGSIVEYRWDFDGDGTVDLTTSDPVVSYVYEESGTYNPVLTAVDDAGAAASYTGTIYVSPVTLVATRSISAMTVLPGYTFRVTVRIRADQDMAGVGLDEDLPVGWEVTPVENGGAIFKRATTQWVFMDMLRAGTERVITYDVTVPEADVLKAIRLPQRFCIQGTVQAKVPEVVAPVGGESCVMVNDCLPVLEAIAHLVPAEAPGQTDKIDLRLPETITEQQLRRAAELWAMDQPVVDTCGETIDQATLKLIAAYAESCTPIDRPLPEMPKANVTVTRTILAPIPCQGVVLGFYDSAGNPIGNTFTVKVEVTTDADVIAVGIDEDLPIGWKVTPLDNGGFVYKPSKIQWTYLGLLRAGETRTIVYEVEVPPTLPVEPPPPDGCGIYHVEHIAGVADTGLPCIEDIPIGGDNRVELTKCLNVIVAISRWDVERDTVDLSLSDLITLPQVQRAVAFWLEEESVPYTCGAKIDFETLKEIIALWLTNTPICEALPAAAPGECQGR